MKVQMDFAGAADRVRNLVAQKRPDRQSPSALVPNVLRDNLVADAEAQTTRFRAALRDKPIVRYDVTNEDGTTENRQFEWDSYGELLRDVSRALFDWDEPELAGPNDIKQSSRFNRDVLAEYMNSEAYRNSRPYTRDNEGEALFGSIAAAKVLKDSASQIAAHIASSEALREAENELGSAEDILDRLREEAKQKYANGEPIPPHDVDAIKQAVKDKRRLRGVYAGALADANAQHSAAVQAAASLGQNMAQATEEAVDSMGSLPGLAPGSGATLTPDQRIELAEKIADNRQLRKIAKMCGRLIRDMRFKRQSRSKNVKVEPTGITTGRDLELMLPHEAARAFMPQMRPLWIKDYTSRSLLEYEMSGKTPAGKGPIVYVFDGSYSMEGENFLWASALGLALLAIAQREKRTFGAVQFGSVGQLKTWLFPARQPADPATVLDMATYFWAGGTDIYSGMAEAKRIIESEPGFRTADVILATDGLCGFGQRDKEVRDRLIEQDVRIHGISIKAPGNHYCQQMCEWSCDVFDLAGSNEATDRLSENIT